MEQRKKQEATEKSRQNEANISNSCRMEMEPRKWVITLQKTSNEIIKAKTKKQERNCGGRRTYIIVKK